LKKWWKKAVTPMDLLIAAIAVYLFTQMDFQNLQTFDYVYIVVFGLWFVMTIVKVIIYYKDGHGGIHFKEPEKPIDPSDNRSRAAREGRGHHRKPEA